MKVLKILLAALLTLAALGTGFCGAFGAQAWWNKPRDSTDDLGLYLMVYFIPPAIACGALAFVLIRSLWIGEKPPAGPPA